MNVDMIITISFYYSLLLFIQPYKSHSWKIVRKRGITALSSSANNYGKCRAFPNDKACEPCISASFIDATP